MTSADEIKRFTMFKSMDDISARWLLEVLRPQVFKSGAVLFERGDPGDAMVLIRQGTVEIFLRDDQGEAIAFRRYGPGQIVGEFALLDGKPRSASARAVDGELNTWLLKQEDFQKLLKERPVVGLDMMRGLAERVRYTTDYLRRLQHAAELLGSSDYDQALQEMTVSASDDEMQALITAFLELVHSMQQRDARLKRVAARPRVTLDPRE